MTMLVAALLLMAQDGLSYQGPALDQFSPDAYGLYFDRIMSGPAIALEGDDTDSLLTSIKTEKCVTRIKAKAQTGPNMFKGPERSLEIDWKTVETVGQDVPYFFAVFSKGGKRLAFLTGGEPAQTPIQQADMLSITTAYGVATMLHATCNPAARPRPDAASPR